MHSAFKSFACELSQVMVIEDVEDWHKVEAVLEHKGKTWKVMMISNSDAKHQQVWRLYPPPHILVPHLEALFTSWRYIKCSLDPSRGLLFSESAWKAAQGVIHVAKLGIISDPPGYPLYYKMGTDWDGCLIIAAYRGLILLNVVFIYLSNIHLDHYEHHLSWQMLYFAIYVIGGTLLLDFSISLGKGSAATLMTRKEMKLLNLLPI